MTEAGSAPVSCDVLVVGAGPTGLALAAQLNAHGASVLVVDQNGDRAKESRALAVQPRTLEVLRPFRLSDVLLQRGNPAATLLVHTGRRVVRTKLFDIGMEDTEFPFLLFVSQAETEAVLGDYLAAHDVPVHREVRLEDIAETAAGCTSTLRRAEADTFQVRTKYVVGCDGAHSSVRELAGIGFLGAGYPQTFLLADLDLDGLEDDTLNAFLTDSGPFLFFPLDRPAPWRIITMRTAEQHGVGRDDPASVSTHPVSMQELQTLADRATGKAVHLHEPVWSTAFRLHHRRAATYRSGRKFLAGDAAHIHSPAGAQGMNTGIQDAINLGWKLALACRGLAPEPLLDSYDAERRPVGEFVLRFTDRAFTAATSNTAVLRFVRREVVPRVLPVALRFSTGRALGFRTVSQLGIRYRSSPAVEPPSRRPRHRGPRAGDRLPDAPVRVDGRPTRLHEEICGAGFHLLLFGSSAAWENADVDALGGDLVGIHRFSDQPRPGALHDDSQVASRMLRVRDVAVFVVRPDGHIGYRGDGPEIDGARRYLARMLTHF